jgi:hypothetical protein
MDTVCLLSTPDTIHKLLIILMEIGETLINKTDPSLKINLSLKKIINPSWLDMHLSRVITTWESNLNSSTINLKVSIKTHTTQDSRRKRTSTANMTMRTISNTLETSKTIQSPRRLTINSWLKKSQKLNSDPNLLKKGTSTMKPWTLWTQALSILRELITQTYIVQLRNNTE